jgi:hypothetical protein
VVFEMASSNLSISNPVNWCHHLNQTLLQAP